MSALAVETYETRTPDAEGWHGVPFPDPADPTNVAALINGPRPYAALVVHGRGFAVASRPSEPRNGAWTTNRYPTGPTAGRPRSAACGRCPSSSGTAPERPT